MKTQLMTYTLAGALLTGTAANTFANEEKIPGGVTHSVTAEDVQGKDLWDFHGKKLGSIESVLLFPADGFAFVVVDTSLAADDSRKVAVPWSKLHVKAKEGSDDEVIYTLDATKAKLDAAPAYTSGADGRFDMAKGKMACDYWGVEKTGKTTAAGGAQNPARKP
jgi:hypothetical protein